VASLAYYFNNYFLLLIVPPALYLQYELGRAPKIKDQRSLERYVRRVYGKRCQGMIVFDKNASLYAFFPSRMRDNTAVLNEELCVIKTNGEIRVMGVYDGIEEALKLLSAAGKPELSNSRN
jgi:hypothetical protein